MSQNDKESLEKCHQRYLNHEFNPQALHIFAKNSNVDAHNEQMLEKLCTDIRSFDVIQNGRNSTKKSKISAKRLSVPLRLAINARGMITTNISVIDGIANGVKER